MITPIDRRHTNARMSKIVSHAGFVFLCGQTSGGTNISDIAGQTREVLKRIDTLLAEAETDKSRLLSATIYLRDVSDFDAMNKEWEAWMPNGVAPARTTVEARLGDPSLLVEITVLAAA
jgi:enamine deaminase RidA (YjgF/YER057c/UK114 family)